MNAHTHTHSLVETPSCLQHLMSYVPSKACHVQSFQANWCVSPNKKAQPALYVVQNRSRLPLAALCKSSPTQFVACPAAGLGLLRLLGVDKTKDDSWHCIASFFPRQSVMSMPNCIRQSVQCHILSGSLTNSKDARPCTHWWSHTHTSQKNAKHQTKYEKYRHLFCENQMACPCSCFEISKSIWAQESLSLVRRGLSSRERSCHKSSISAPARRSQRIRIHASHMVVPLHGPSLGVLKTYMTVCQNVCSRFCW